MRFRGFVAVGSEKDKRVLEKWRWDFYILPPLKRSFYFRGKLDCAARGRVDFAVNVMWLRSYGRDLMALDI